MSSRAPARIVVGLLAGRRLLSMRTRRRPARTERILVATYLRIGDTLMLTPLLAKLRAQHPAAEIVVTVPPPMLALYQRRPYGVRAVSYDPYDVHSLRALRALAGFDLALIPADNRYSWLARALDARWIVAFAGDRPAYKSWPVDELRHYRDAPAAWPDMAADLVDGPPPARYRPEDWPVPEAAPFTRPPGRYALLHVEASTPLKQWDDAKWAALAEATAARGLTPVWSAGRNGESYLRNIDPAGRFAMLGHKLDLAQLWRLVAGAALLVAPDTSVAHIGKLTFTPTVTLFGPGAAVLFGAGDFWRDAPYRAVTLDAFPCRDQRTLFKRELPWVRHCARGPSQCGANLCMQGLSVAMVNSAIDSLLRAGGAGVSRP